MKIQKLLKIALRINGVFSGTTGAIALIASSAVATFLSVQPAWIVAGVGVNLLGFALILFYLSSRAAAPRTVIQSIIALDLLWVLGSAVLIPLGFFSNAGALALSLIAAIVLTMAALQYAGLRQSTQPSTHTRTESASGVVA